MPQLVHLRRDLLFRSSGICSSDIRTAWYWKMNWNYQRQNGSCSWKRIMVTYLATSWEEYTINKFIMQVKTYGNGSLDRDSARLVVLGAIKRKETKVCCIFLCCNSVQYALHLLLLELKKRMNIRWIWAVHYCIESLLRRLTWHSAKDSSTMRDQTSYGNCIKAFLAWGRKRLFGTLF